MVTTVPTSTTDTGNNTLPEGRKELAPLRDRLAELREKQQNAENPHKDILLKEYEIIQRKLDNYGRSSIAYKGFSVAILGATALGKGAPVGHTFVAGLAVLFVIMLIEVQNCIFETRLAERVLVLERALNNRLVVRKTPMIAAVLSRKKIPLLTQLALLNNHIFEYWRKHTFHFAAITIMLSIGVNNLCGPITLDSVFSWLDMLSRGLETMVY